ADQPTVGFNLRFARTTQKSEAATLALQMCPAPYQPAALPGEMGEFDLQPAFPRAGALAEDLENERSAIQDLRVPCFLEIALLNRAQRGIDDDEFRLERPSLSRD